MAQANFSAAKQAVCTKYLLTPLISFLKNRKTCTILLEQRGFNQHDPISSMQAERLTKSCSRCSMCIPQTMKTNSVIVKVTSVVSKKGASFKRKILHQCGLPTVYTFKILFKLSTLYSAETLKCTFLLIFFYRQ